jgi:hypothetical protein
MLRIGDTVILRKENDPRNGDVCTVETLYLNTLDVTFVDGKVISVKKDEVEALGGIFNRVYILEVVFNNNDKLAIEISSLKKAKEEALEIIKKGLRHSDGDDLIFYSPSVIAAVKVNDAGVL